MVNRPPASGGGSSRRDELAALAQPSLKRNSSRGAPKRGLEWSLRSLHSIDTGAQHFLSNYYETEESESVVGVDSTRSEVILEEDDQSAYEIFKAKDDRASGQRARDSVWAPMHAPLRTGIVDGKRVVFELLSDVTQRPTTSRKERLNRSHTVVNSARSSWETRVRLWLMHFEVPTISAVFLICFIFMNVLFAIAFYYTDEKCCADDSFTFGEIFAFTIQTSTTIGYGSMSPLGRIPNFLVVMLSYFSTLTNTIFAGLLFAKFTTPVITIQFSEVMTLCNVNGVPCLSLRIGNADGRLNPLTDINVRLTYSYRIPYTDHNGHEKYFQQTEEIRLLSNRQHDLKEVFTLRHVLDESSPLFGLNFTEHPADKIYVFTLSVDAVQNLTKSQVNLQTEYALEDIMIGHTFERVLSFEKEGRLAVSDFSKLSDTEPYPVWYPAVRGAYDTRDPAPRKNFGP